MIDALLDAWQQAAWGEAAWTARDLAEREQHEEQARSARLLPDLERYGARPTGQEEQA